VFIDEDVDDILDDVKNVTNTYDRDMGGKKWIMKKEGLTKSRD